MAVHYALFPNRLTPDPNDYSAVVQTGDSADLGDVADRIILGGSVLGRAEIIAVLELLLPVIAAILKEGRRVNLGGLVELFPRIRGVFNGQADVFDSSRHQVDVGANPGSRVRREVQNGVEVIKDTATLPSPSPLAFVDHGSGTENDQYTQNHIATVTGNLLQYNKEAADEGIYLVMLDAGGEVKVPNDNVPENMPSRLMFLTPGNVSGTLRLEVRARVGDSSQLRTGALASTLNAPV